MFCDIQEWNRQIMRFMFINELTYLLKRMDIGKANTSLIYQLNNSHFKTNVLDMKQGSTKCKHAIKRKLKFSVDYEMCAWGFLLEKTSNKIKTKSKIDGISKSTC